MRTSLILVILFLLTGCVEYPLTKGDWLVTWGCETCDMVIDHTTDPCGNIYVVGMFSNEIDLDPGPDSFITGPDDGSHTYVSCFDREGNFLWAQTWDGLGPDVFPASIDTDGASCILIAGAIFGEADFDPGPDVDLQSSVGDHRNGFLMKLDIDGGYEWVRTWSSIGEFSEANPFWVRIDPSRNILVGGNLKNRDIQGEIGNMGGAYISRFDFDGNLEWSITWGAIFSSRAVIDPNGGITLLGLYEDIVDFDPGPGEELRFSNGEQCIVRINSDGEFQWVGTGAGCGKAIAVDSEGSCYILGSFFGENNDLDPGPGEYHMDSVEGWHRYLSKLDSDGRLLWVKLFESSERSADNIFIDNDDRVIILESTNDSSYRPGSPVAPLRSEYNWDARIYVSVLDPDGSLLVTKYLEGGLNSMGIRATSNRFGDFFLTGSFNKLIKLESGEVIPARGTGEISNTDSFLCRFDFSDIP